MPTRFLIIDPSGDQIGTADTLDGVKRIVSHCPPGRYHVDEVASPLNPLPSGHTARRWGMAIR